MKKYSRFDMALVNLGTVLIGGFWFGVLYGIEENDGVAFKWGMILFGVTSLIAIYIALKYKIWRKGIHHSKNK